MAASAEKQDFWNANATIRKSRTQAVAARSWLTKPTALTQAVLKLLPEQTRDLPKLFKKWPKVGLLYRQRAPSLGLLLASLAGLAVGLIAFMPFAYSYDFAQQSDPLRRHKDYAHGAIENVMADWNLYRQLDRHDGFVSRLPGRIAIESALKASFYNNLMASADRILNEYRNSPDRDLSAIDWARAKLCLRFASAINPGGTEAKGKLALCKGYEELAANPKPPRAADSVQDFRLAASLLPHSPDPHLALARVYIYSYRNLAPALTELHQAEQLGYRFGPQETKQEADGY